MLIRISEIFETLVSTLLGEKIPKSKIDDLKTISEKLEIINLQLLQRRNNKRKIIHWALISISIIIVLIFILLFLLKSPYLNWNYNNPEEAVLGVNFHYFEWLFVRIVPI